MNRRHWIPIAVLVLFALLLGGCINIQQEYWLYEDGSAKVGMDIGMSQALLSMGGIQRQRQQQPIHLKI